MNKSFVFPVVFAMTLLSVSCDFPDDPPINVGPPLTPPPPDHIIQIDDSTYFINYVYKNEASTTQVITDTIRTVHAPNGDYLRAMYWFDNYSGSEPDPEPILPPFFRNESDGLSMYHPAVNAYLLDSVQLFNPVLYFKLPYPAEVGDIWTQASNPYKIELIRKDTVVMSYNKLFTKNCWLYRVYRVGQTSTDTIIDIFVAIGEYIFKVIHFQYGVTASTLLWKKL